MRRTGCPGGLGATLLDPSVDGPMPPARPGVAIPMGLVVGVGAGGVPAGIARGAPPRDASPRQAHSRSGPRRALPPRPSDNLPTSRSRQRNQEGSLQGWTGRFLISRIPLTDEELTTLALAEDPLEPLPDDAVPLSVHLARFGPALPLWYMPSATRRVGGRSWRIPIVIAVVSSFVLIDALGLCNTYGLLGWA